MPDRGLVGLVRHHGQRDGIGYCKVETLTTWGAPPSTTGETKIRCYTPAGVPIAAPRLTFTHVTSDAYGPC